MAFTAAELDNITNSVLNTFLGKGTVYAQAIQNKPMMRAFDESPGEFPGGKGELELRIKKGDGGLTLAGYTHDDQVAYGNPTPTKVIKYPWKEHHIGMGLTHTELKHDGIIVTESGADQTNSRKSGREQFFLVEKIGENELLTGIQSLILDDPALGSTGGFARTTSWWRNRAATAAALAADSGPGAVTSDPAGGGALMQFLQREYRQIRRYGSPQHRCFAGSDWIDAMERELRANGNYADAGWRSRRSVDAGMNTDAGVPFKTWNFVYDPTMDDLGQEKRAYVIDMRAIKLYYMIGEKMKRANPARPHDRYVQYKAITTTAALTARQLNTSAVYDIA